MPRKATKIEKVVETVSRKPYPDRETRISMANAKIAQLQKLNAERAALIEKTEEKLNERKITLAKGIEQLERVTARRDKLIANTAETSSPSGRAIKASEKAKMQELIAKLAEKGMTIDDMINSI